MIKGWNSKRAKTCICFALAIAWCLVFSATAVSQNPSRDLSWLTPQQRQWLKEHPVIRVAPTPHFPPFEYWEEVEKDGIKTREFRGVVSSYLDHFASELGVRFEMVETEKWTQNLDKLKSREIDAVSLIVPWTDRDYVKVSEPYISYPSVIVVTKDVTGELSLKDLVGKRVAVPEGYTGQKFLAQNHPKIVVVPAKDPADGIRMVFTGEVDAFFGGAAIVAHLAEQEGATNLRIAGESDFQYQNGFGVRSDWGIFADIITETLKRVTPTQRSEFHAGWIREGFFKKRFYESARFWWILGSIISTLVVGSAIMVVWNRKQAAFIDRLEIEQQKTEQAKKEAEAANEAKSAFVATISREIRTPMNGVLGMCELLRGTGLDRQQSEYLEFAHGSAENLVGLINDILDFSKMEAGKLELESEPFSLKKLVADVITLMETQTEQSQSRKHQIELMSEVEEDVSSFYIGDPLRIRQVLLNLVSNAIKFTEKGHVKVKITRDVVDGDSQNHLVRFAVEDTGIGVAADKLADIFEPFEQEETSTTRKFGGTGLGLTICKTLAEMMGGTAFATSKQGEGSVFGFTAKLQPTDGSDLPDDHKDSGDAATRSCSVLLAEDGLVNQKVAIGLLEARGHKVHLVETGIAALEAIENNSYDAVLMDIEMPGMDGLTAIRKLRERESKTGTQHQRVFAITGHGMKGDRERCLAAGMDGHLVKPFKPADLYAAVESGGNGAVVQADDDSKRQSPKKDSRSTEQSVIDRDQALQTTGGDQQLADELLETCLTESPAILAEAKSSVEEKDFATARRCGHSLATSFAAVGAMKAAEAAKQLQNLETDKIQSYREIIFEIESAFAEITSFVGSSS